MTETEKAVEVSKIDYACQQAQTAGVDGDKVVDSNPGAGSMASYGMQIPGGAYPPVVNVNSSLAQPSYTPP